MYSFLNYKFIGGGGLIVLLIAFLFLDFTYDPYSIRSNVKYGNYAQAKELFIKELTYSDRLPDVLDNIQEYYAYMPQEYTYYVKSSTSRYIRLNEQTASRNIESIESIIQNNPSTKFDEDKYNFLIAYISLLEFNVTRAQTYIPQIKDKEKYNVEMLKSWSDLYTNDASTILKSAQTLELYLSDKKYAICLTQVLFKIYYNTRNWEKLDALCSSSNGKYLTHIQKRNAYLYSNVLLFEYYSILSFFYTENIIIYLLVFLCFFLGFYYYVSFDTFNPNPFSFYLKLIGISASAYFIFILLLDILYVNIDINYRVYYTIYHSGYSILSLTLVYVLFKKKNTYFESYDYFLIAGISTLVFSSITMLLNLNTSGVDRIGYHFIFENFFSVAFTSIGVYQFIYTVYELKKSPKEGIIRGIVLSILILSLHSIILYFITDNIIYAIYLGTAFILLAIPFNLYLLNSINLSKSFTIKNNPSFLNFANGLILIFISIILLLLIYYAYIFDNSSATAFLLDIYGKQKALLIAAILLLTYKITPMKGYVFSFNEFISSMHPYTYIERELYEKGTYWIQKYYNTKSVAHSFLPNAATFVRMYPINKKPNYFLLKLESIPDGSNYSDFIIIKIMYDQNLSSDYVQLYLIPQNNWSESTPLSRQDLVNAGLVRCSIM